MKVAILLAAHNGVAWLPIQVDSILSQRDVEVHLYISDDCSVDGTSEWLASAASKDSRITVLPPGGPFGSAGKNFYYLIKHAELKGEAYIAFSDQDDYWYADKVSNSIKLINSKNAAAVSGNVVAFWEGGRRKFVNKAQSLRDFDFIFEAAGPGCTYLMTASFYEIIKSELTEWGDKGRLPVHHDWFCYALCRARGERWFIDSRPSMDYRQHESNEVGVNSGFCAAAGRHRKLVSGWYRQEVLGMVRLALRQAEHDQELQVLARRIERGSFLDRLFLCCQSWRFRRRRRDQLILAAYFLTGLFWAATK